MTQLAPEGSDPAAVAADDLVDAMAALVGHHDYPCLGARSVFRRERATVRVYSELGSSESVDHLLQDLQEFAGVVEAGEGFASFVAIFRGPVIVDEEHFEGLSWSQLRGLHRVDQHAWNAGVSADPNDPHFAFSAGGTPFFVVGLHPQASRDARRAATPTLVFNLHEQFEALRESGQFPRMRDRIRQRDEHLQGSVNPMVADYGEGSEARQYSGRHVASAWQAPFEAQTVVPTAPTSPTAPTPLRS